MFLAPTEAPSTPSELQTPGHMQLAGCHSQSHHQKTSRTESPLLGLNPLSLVGLHPAGQI